MRTWMLIGIVGVAAAAWLPAGLAVPQPALVPPSWELDFEYRDPQRIVLRLPGQEKEHTYWYTIFTVTNNTGQDVELIPTFELLTDTLQTLENNIGVPTGVFAAIKRRHARLYPLLSNPMKAFGRLLQGDDNAKDCVAIWPQFDLEASKFAVYVGGLSGEQRNIINPAWLLKEQNKELPNVKDVPQFFNLQKTLRIDYKLPGDRRTRETVNPGRSGQSWVMR